ncbi:chloride channel protein [Chitinophagaceae bacterium MMS25-I14]
MQTLHLGKFLIRAGRFRVKHIKHRNFIMIVSLIVGLLSALAAVSMKLLVQFVEHKTDKLNDIMGSNWLSAFFPLVGAGISLFILLKIYRGKLTGGVGGVFRSILTNKSRVERRNILGNIITGSITLAFGGSAGLEAPIVTTGAAIGSSTATDLRFSERDTTLLLACGTASGIAAIFNSPIAGILFVLEVFLLDFSIPFFIPLLISTATATVVSQILYPDKFVFLVINGWNIKAIPFYILLGVACGFLSVYVNNMVEMVEHYFAKRDRSWKTWLMAGIPLCMLIFLVPKLYGEGYFTITELLHGRTGVLTAHSVIAMPHNSTITIVLMCLSLILIKPFSASLTVCAGGNGGIFAPSLFIGAILGFLFSYLVNISGIFQLNNANFIIAAMAGVLAGVMHAPLTAIFLLAEITGGYTLFVPLMIVTAISYFMTRKYVRYSIYHKPLVENSILIEKFPEEDHL